MYIKINDVRIPIEMFKDQAQEQEILKGIVTKKLKVAKSDIKQLKIIKESVDARRKGKITFVYALGVTLYGDEKKVVRHLQHRNVQYVKQEDIVPLKKGTQKLITRPIIIGTGPAGLFAGLILASEGYNPLLVERGDDVHQRTEKVHDFWKGQKLDPDSNVQFGEGGAGTFSDGKLTTRIHDRRGEKVLQAFVDAGAPREILYRAKPHIGTDRLKKVVENMRNQIYALGGEVRFNAKLTDIYIKNDKISGIEVNSGEYLPCDVLLLAIGHSARDTYEMLLQRELKMVQKPFSMGVRIEHNQQDIDAIQYGSYAGHPKLKAAEYQLVYKQKDRTCYSFCMCPGGVVVAAASEPKSIVTNGMSEFARDRENANSALVVSVGPNDFEGSHPLSGVAFQRRWEHLAYVAGGENGAAPVQYVGDFLNVCPSTVLKDKGIKPSYTGKVHPTDLTKCLPSFVTDTMQNGLRYFDNKIKGYADPNVIMTGVETRTSAPIRMPRTEDGQSVSIQGVYPAGEGAGYAGGIVSAAVDGIRIAELVMQKHAPLV